MEKSAPVEGLPHEAYINQELQRILRPGIDNRQLREHIEVRLIEAINNLGDFKPGGAVGVAKEVSIYLRSSLSLLEKEQVIRDTVFTKLEPRESGGRNFSQCVSDDVEARHCIMFDQISPFIPQDPPCRIGDVGAGDGRMRALLESSYPKLAFDAWDVVLSDDTKSFVKQYDGTRIPVHDGYYHRTLSLTVAHHTADPEAFVRELVRVTRSGGAIIMIETLVGDYFGDTQKDHDVCYVMDYFWRLCTGSREPVTGQYRTIAEWKELFIQQGCCVYQEKPLGHDQAIMTEQHALMVFMKR